MRAAGLALALVLLAAGQARAAPRLEALSPRFDQPVGIAGPPGDGSRLMVVEKRGTMQVVKDGVKSAAPFLDVSSITSSAGERGLLSIAFPPGHQQTGLFYVYLTAVDAASSTGEGEVQVREYRRTDPGIGGCPGRLTDPVLEQTHDAGWIAIVGGHVVRDPGLPTLAGRYLYGDHHHAELHTADLAAGQAGDAGTGLSLGSLSAFGEDACGHLYAASLDAGTVSRLVDGSPSACTPATPGVARFRTLRRSLAAGRTVTLMLWLSRPAARKLGRATRRHAVRARLRVRGVDAAGNARIVRRSPRVR